MPFLANLLLDSRMAHLFCVGRILNPILESLLRTLLVSRFKHSTTHEDSSLRALPSEGFRQSGGTHYQVLTSLTDL